MSVQKAIFPGVILGIFALIGLTSFLVARPGVGKASAQADPAPAPLQSQSNTAASIQNNEGCSISPNYPESIRQWCGFIERYAQENAIDPNLISAVMLQESAGQPDAYSKSGAVGLMQVMPRDGKAASFTCKNGPCFADRPSMQELFDPEFNVAYGARMLSGLIAHYGDVREALKAYGPKDVGYYYADLVLGTFNGNQ